MRRLVSALRSPATLRTLAAVAALAAPGADAVAQDTPDPIARLSVPDAQATVVVGQPVTVGVEVLVPTFFRGAPSYEALELPGAITFFNERGTNFTRRIDGSTWAGQRRSYTVYPNRSGSFDVGPTPVEVRYGVGSSVVIDTAFAPAVRFDAVVPDEAAGLPVFVAAAELRIEQSLDPVRDTLRVGEAVSRTVVTEVDGTLSVVVPPVAFDSIEGLAVYPAPPRLQDTGGERGSAIVGQRIESVSYVAQSEGSYQLPAVTIDWWDWTTSRLRRAEAPAITFVVVANPDLVSEIELPPDSLDVAERAAVDGEAVGVSARMRRLFLWLVGAALFGYAAYRLAAPRIPPARARLAARRNARAESESTYFQRLTAAAAANDAQATVNALAAWLDRFEARERRWTARELARAAGDGALTEELERLDRAIFGRDASDAADWSGRLLSQRLIHARTALVRATGPGAPGSRAHLAPLNPGESNRIPT